MIHAKPQRREDGLPAPRRLRLRANTFSIFSPASPHLGVNTDFPPMGGAKANHV